jgi:hypothetical protein
MASINFNLPNDIAWGDYLLDGRSVKFTVEVTKPSEEKTDVVNIQKEPAAPEPYKPSRPMPWCKRGNSCLWKNCKFRHEICKHHDQWQASGCKGRACRSLKYDPLSKKCPADGGCMYDHRNKADLREFIYTLKFDTAEEMFDAFRPLGLGVMTYESEGRYTTHFMDKENRALLIRSLNAARDDDILFYGEDEDIITVHFIKD